MPHVKKIYIWKTEILIFRALDCGVGLELRHRKGDCSVTICLNALLQEKLKEKIVNLFVKLNQSNSIDVRTI